MQKIPIFHVSLFICYFFHMEYKYRFKNTPTYPPRNLWYFQHSKKPVACECVCVCVFGQLLKAFIPN